MLRDFQTFQDLFNSKRIEMTDSCFNFLIQKFQFVYIQAETANIFNSENRIESDFIIIDENINYKDTKEDYYILCFISRQKYTLLIIKQSDINLIQSFLTQNKRIHIYYLRKKEQEKLHSIFNNITIENLSIYFDQEISNFNSRFSLKNSSLTKFWNVIKNSISGFLIKKSYEDSFFERIGQLPRKFDPKPPVVKMTEDEFIFLRHLNKNYISVKLIYHIQKGQIFVIKFQSDDEEDKLIEREKQNYLNIDHLFIPKYYGYGETFGNNFIVFEYINGHNLNDIEKLKLSKSDKISIIYELIMAFQYIHNKGFIYRDLKPDNVIIDKNKTAVLIDFDRLISNPTDFTQITVNFAHKYHAPEIVLGSFTNSCDIYSLGLIIYYIMTEKEPMIDLENPSKTLIDFPSEFPELKKICEKCIQKDPRKRYESKKLGDIFFNYCLYNDEVDMQTKEKILDVFDSIMFYENRKLEYSSLLYNVALLYYKYIITNNSIIRSFKYFEYSAKLNNLQSQKVTGFIYYEYKNYNKAVYYLTMAADRNDQEAQYRLGLIYYHILNEVNKSFYYLSLSSNQNNPNAQYMLALFYLKGKYVKQDIQKAIYLLNLSANQNNHDAQYELAKIYLEGQYVKQDIQKAIDLLTSLANQGFLNAQLELIEIYLTYNTPQYFPKAIHLCKLASEQNNNKFAQYYLGSFYLHGVCCEKNVNKAIKYLTLSANQNHADALYMLGRIYSLGKKANRDINKSFKFFSLAAQQNHVESLFSLGWLYEKGIGVEINMKKAINYYSIAAEYKNEDAMFNLAVFYYNGIYVKQDVNKSISLLTYLANLNHSYAQLFLGKIYLEGGNVRKNDKKALKYLSLSANQNNKQAQYTLGECYLDGFITPRDIYRSIHYLELASKQNFIKADYLLGHIYFEVLKKEYNKGLKYFKHAADSNDPDAQYAMGQLYYEGRCVERDMNKAFHYFKMSADQKNKFAQHRLGILYKNGEYVNYDINKAIYYLTLAANQNNSESQFVLGCIYLSPENLDLKKCFDYFSLAADSNNHRDAQYCLAVLYFEGYAIKRDIKKAIFYFKETSSMSNQYSKNNLGIIYKLGDGVDKNISIAIEYFNEAIDRNNDSAAMFNLAHIYLYEEGVKFDLDKAIGLLIKATLLENNFAFNLLKLALIKKYKNISKLVIENELKNNGVKKIDKLVNQIYNDIIKRNLTNPNYFIFSYEINKDINLVYDLNFNYKQIDIKIEKKSQMTSKSFNEINSDFYAGFKA